MLPDKIISWFLPKNVRNDKTHARYHELYSLVGTTLIGTMTMSVIPVMLFWAGYTQHLWLYYLNALCHLVTLTFVKFTGHYRILNMIAAIVAYFIIFTWVEGTGLIYSVNICFIHIFLLAGILVDRKWGWTTIVTNIVFLIVIYNKTLTGVYALVEYKTLGSPLYALILHCIITTFLGSFLAYSLHNAEKTRKSLIALRDNRINLLDTAVKKRTEQIDSMRQTIAADFHDQTGNMLAAINRQTSILQLKLHDNKELFPLLDSIMANSNGLYASSKDFLWSLNNDSDNPATLFEYLTAYGQNFYNQFDIGFSTKSLGHNSRSLQLSPFAALNLIYIFKEVMTNVIKHSGATEVIMQIIYGEGNITYIVMDNGTWKDTDPGISHFGLKNIERRSEKSGFGYKLTHGTEGTSVAISLSANPNINQVFK